MGAGAAGSGGSDKSDERKVDTYADQLKKIQAKKSKFKTNKFGYKVKKSPFEQYADKNPVIQTVTNVADNLNLNRRMKFANKKGINIQGLSTEEILSKDFKTKLDAQGYTREVPTDNTRDNDNNNQPAEPVIVKKNIGGTEVQTTQAKLDEEKAKDDEYDVRKVKKKGRKRYTLTSSKGVTQVSDDYSLGKKTLLGFV
jgi:hypothetical protein